MPDILAAVTAVVRSTEALYTVYRPGPDGRVAQFRELPEEPLVDLVELDGRTLEQAAAQWFTELPPFEPAVRAPVRFAVAGTTGPDRMLLVALHHIVIDSFGVLALRRLLGAALEGRPIWRDPAAATDPAGPEPAGGAAAMDYWTAVFDDYPATTLPFARAVGGGGQRIIAMGCRSGDAVATLARRCRVPESILVAAVFALVLARAGGNRRTVVRVSSANRFEPGDANRIACLAQTVPVPLTVPAAGTLAEWARTVKTAFGAIYRHGRFDFDRVRTLQSRRQFTAGINLETMVSVNYIDRGAAEEPAVPTGAVVAGDAFLDLADPLGFLVRRAGSHLALTVQFDPGLVPESLARTLLLSSERLLLGAEGPDDPIGGLLARLGRPAPDPGRWVERDGCRIGLHVVEDVLRAHPAVAYCRVAPSADDSGRIVAHVRGLGPFACRVHLLAHLAEHPAAVVPDRFVTNTAEGSGTGLDAPAFEDDSPAGLALRDALARLHPGAGWSGAASFLTAGGEVGTIDAMLRLLEEAGFTGLRYADLYGYVPPAQLVTRLRPVVAQ